MDKVIDFIKRNQIVLIICVIAIFVFWFFIRPELEQSDDNNKITESFDEDLKQFINKNVHIYTMIKNDKGDAVKKYIAIARMSDCNNLASLDKNKKETDCNNNLIVLQDSPNTFATFTLNKSPSTDTFTLQSILKDKIPELSYIDQTQFYTNKSDKLCGDQISGSALIKFELEKKNTGYIIRFKRPLPSGEGKEYGYVTKCRDNICLQSSISFDRLCISQQSIDALLFNFELANDKANKNKEPFTDIESQDSQTQSLNLSEPSLGSLRDLLSLCSDEGSMDSRASKAYLINGAYENFDGVGIGNCTSNCATWKK